MEIAVSKRQRYSVQEYFRIADASPNPTVLFEVLSPATEAADRGEKFIWYINIPSLKAYFLVAQHKAQITSFVRRDDGSWSVGDFVVSLDGRLNIPCIGVELPMREIYANVKFETETA